MIRDTVMALGAVFFGFGLLCGYCAGVAVTRHRDAGIIHLEREAKRLALDACTAEMVLAFPTAHECAMAAQDFLSREGYRAVHFEGVR